MRYIYKTQPRKYQVEAIKFLIEREGVGALLMDPGTGKTWVMLNYLGILAAKYGSIKALICAPLSGLDTWVDQAQEHLGHVVDDEGNELDILVRMFVVDGGRIEEKAEFIASLEEVPGLTMVIINHDAFKYRHKAKGMKSVTVRDRILKAVREKWCPDIVVVDEMHRLKSHNSNLSTAFHKIGDSAPMRTGMTGTVAPHSLLDFFSQWKYLDPRVFGHDWNAFRYYYAIYGGWEGKQVIGYYADRQLEMKEKIKSTSFIIRKHEALDLPKVTDILVPVELTTERSYYLEMGRELLAELPSGKLSISKNTLTKMLRLRQITGGVLGYREPGGLDAEGNIKEISKSEDIGDTKLKYLLDKVETIHSAGEKQVIFAHFRRDIERITEACTKTFKGTPVYSISGATKNAQRVTQRKAFYNDTKPSIFVAQMRTVSLAINEFVVASYGHFYSYSQLRDDFIQARDRLDRSGQTSPVTFYHYVVPKSIDAAILKSHKEKTKLEAAVTKEAKEILTLGE